MKSDVILAGVGGQGILSIAAVIGMAAIGDNLFLKQAEVHGMSQRGGSVQSHLRMSNSEVASDLIPMGNADLILSVEPMESLRYIPWLSPQGWLVTNTAIFNNIQNYPEPLEILEEIMKIRNHITLNADEIARDLGSIRFSNIVVLGAGCRFIPISKEKFYEGIKKIFGKKGDELVGMNIRAFDAGWIACEEYLNK